MINKIFKKTESFDFVIIDSVFPQRKPFSFRNAEINEYLRKLSNVRAYSMFPMLPGKEAWFSHGYGVPEDEFIENFKGYLAHYPENANKIRHLCPHVKYKFKLAYSFFLAETYTLLPFYESNRIPFTFVLYPGGAFGLENKKSDDMLKAIFQSKQFRSVIVTQGITKEYLLSKSLCSEERIRMVYGGFVQFQIEDVKPKQHYKAEKDTFDICFVAAKYTDQGMDKGYDLFIEAAKRICKIAPNAYFHVVGGFDEKDIAIDGLDARIKFYGYRQPDFLLDFYSGMDICISPSRPNSIFPGNFDGFPLGADASYCGVALMVADELNMNTHYINNQELCILPLDPKIISARVVEFYHNPKSLYELSIKGQQKTQKLFDLNYQIDSRIEVFSEFVELAFE